MKIGVGVTTYNRAHLIEQLIIAYKNTIEENDTILLFSDDGSTDDTLSILNSSGIAYLSEATKNIALNKNRALKYLYDNNCDYYFLLDDDLIPIKSGWITAYINAFNNTPVKHFLWASPEWGSIVEQKMYGETKVDIYDHPIGVFYAMTKEVVDNVGAFDYGMHRYGFEHVDWTLRAQRCGYTDTEGWNFPHLHETSDSFVNLGQTNSLLNIEVTHNELIDMSGFNERRMNNNTKENIIHIPFQS